jgi:hypothetical protein
MPNKFDIQYMEEAIDFYNQLTKKQVKKSFITLTKQKKKMILSYSRN